MPSARPIPFSDRCAGASATSSSRRTRRHRVFSSPPPPPPRRPRRPAVSTGPPLPWCAPSPGTSRHPGPEHRRARERDPAPGILDSQLPVGVPRHGPAVAVHHPVVVFAQKGPDCRGRSRHRGSRARRGARPRRSRSHSPGTGTARSRRITSRRWAPVGKRLARPSYMVWPNSSSIATTTVASQARRRTVSRSMRPPCSRSAASSPGSPDPSTRSPRGTWATTKNGLGAAEITEPAGWPSPRSPGRPAGGGWPSPPSPRTRRSGAGPKALFISAAEVTVSAHRRRHRPWSGRRPLGATASSWCGDHRCSAGSEHRAQNETGRPKRTGPGPGPRRSGPPRPTHRTLSILGLERTAPDRCRAVATSTTARTLSKEISPAHKDPTRWGRAG